MRGGEGLGPPKGVKTFRSALENLPISARKIINIYWYWYCYSYSYILISTYIYIYVCIYIYIYIYMCVYMYVLLLSFFSSADRKVFERWSEGLESRGGPNPSPLSTWDQAYCLYKRFICFFSIPALQGSLVWTQKCFVFLSFYASHLHESLIFVKRQRRRVRAAKRIGTK